MPQGPTPFMREMVWPVVVDREALPAGSCVRVEATTRWYQHARDGSQRSTESAGRPGFARIDHQGPIRQSKASSTESRIHAPTSGYDSGTCDLSGWRLSVPINRATL